jgi:hypothetical protein
MPTGIFAKDRGLELVSVANDGKEGRVEEVAVEEFTRDESGFTVAKC